MTEPLTPEEEREVRASMLPASHTYLWVLVRRLLATLDAARSTSEGLDIICGAKHPNGKTTCRRAAALHSEDEG